MFTSGPRALIAKLNKMVRVLNAVSNLRGDGIIKVQQSSSGYTVGISIDQLNARIPKVGGGGIPVRQAFCAEAAGSTKIISAYLDTNDTDEDTGEHIGAQVDVQCAISGDSDSLNNAVRRLEVGNRIEVYSINEGDGPVWKQIGGFQATTECDINPADYSDTAFSAPPTTLELEAVFGTPEILGPGFMAVVNNNNQNSPVYLCFTTATTWQYTSSTGAP